MRVRGSVISLVVCAGMLAIVAAPAHPATLEKGTVELTPSLSFSHNSFSFSGSDAGSLTNMVGSAQVGYCVTDHFEIGGGLLVNYQSIDVPGFGSESATSLGLVGGVQYNFPSGGRTIPFVRGSLGILTNSGSLASGDQTTLIAPSLLAGLRVLVGNSASVNFGVGYQHLSDALGVQELSANTIGAEIGVSIFPRRGY